MTKAADFVVDEKKLAEYRQAIRREYQVEPEPARDFRLTLYDTFDWKLFRKGLFAYRSGDSFVVCESLAGPPKLECAVDEVPRFWWEFESQGARRLLEGATGIRALLRRADIRLEENRFNLRNGDGKIVCRLSLLINAAAVGEKRSYLSIIPLRGYAEEADTARSLARDLEMGELATTLLEDLLLSNGVKPADYTSKLDLVLSTKMTISEAAVFINKDLLGKMRANVWGIVDDCDTEFVHDFRVAIRRTRACLSELKEAFPPQDARKYNADFKAVAKRCNVLRDLDVYLLGKQDYYDMLPAHLHKGLDQYFQYVKRKRKTHHRRFSDFLKTGAPDALFDRWERYLDDPSNLVNDSSAVGSASAKILERFEKIIKNGRKITDSSPDSKLHSLRIDCKKLRYLLEFFRSYYPEKKTSALVGTLKDFQDNLGEFNDLTQQQADLEAYLEHSKSTPRARLRTAAIGGLLTALHNRQLEVRKDFYHRFDSFDSKKNRSTYEDLFG